MTSRTTSRLDAELVRRGLARSRARAAELVVDGRVSVAGATARKPSQGISSDAEVAVSAGPTEYVSRAALKLVGALDALDRLGVPVVVEGVDALDVGASTGGFTQVLLERGAHHVVALDVGHGQLAPELRGDERLTLLEGVNVRDLRPGVLPGPEPSLAVADLSFISLTLALPPVMEVCARGAVLLAMVKPQFEVGRARLGARGVVSSPSLRSEAVLSVVEAARRCGGLVRAVVPSPVPGEHGNVEYFVRVDVGHRGEALEGGASPRIVVAVRSAVVDGTAVLVEEHA
ncbi:TlyA family RNA methyltransferase [Cellulomonas sp. APG4]|uniref:TlyA family RNA methyltransferase n=1 Tax=Cellulomonas sp. APG4 TaxID=1538656 RepID=UPI00137A5D67|nr:TlyA family RNA methyltransferase [Cellulomonas sp. APG4]NCT89920.1 TlyA family RNA methyltransferase [Cellulomonas sp. APG4]